MLSIYFTPHNISLLLHSFDPQHSQTNEEGIEAAASEGTIVLKDALSRVNEKYRQILDLLNIQGLSLKEAAKLTGESERIQESFQSLIFALLLGIFVAYMVLATQFNSFVHPFTVL